MAALTLRAFVGLAGLEAVAKNLGQVLVDGISSKDAMYFATVVIVSIAFRSRRVSLQGLLDGFPASTRRL